VPNADLGYPKCNHRRLHAGRNLFSVVAGNVLTQNRLEARAVPVPVHARTEHAALKHLSPPVSVPGPVHALDRCPPRSAAGQGRPP